MPKIVDHDQYREKLLDQCFDLFSSRGFSNVTMRQIAAELGVSTGTLYHYFPNKLAILEQMLVLLGRRDVEEASRRTAKTGSFEDRLRIFFDYFLEREDDFQKMLLLCVDFLRSSQEDQYRVVYQWAEYYLANMQHYLEIPEAVSKLIVIFFTGLVYHSRLFRDLVDSREQMHLFTDILLAYLRAHQDPANRLCRVCPFLTDHRQEQVES